MDTEEKILASALDVFVRYGFSAPTSMITKNAGISTGILFHYYPTKKDFILQLYSTFILEYYNHITHWAEKYIKEDDLQGYTANLRQTWSKSISWGLQNWQKFQYIQLFESSVLADQFSTKDSKEFESIYSYFVEMTELGVKYGYLKDLPILYLIDITRSIITSTTKYLHHNESDADNPGIQEKFWKVYCDMVMR